MGAVLIVMLIAFGTGGGAATFMVKVGMVTMTDCQAAARRVEGGGSVALAEGGTGYWQARAQCVEGD